MRAFTQNELVEAFRFLDTLRFSGLANMMSNVEVGAHLQREHGLTNEECDALCNLWRSTFDKKATAETRARIAHKEPTNNEQD